jgi:predicted metal-dependent TIM-barrel fold hydrolase
MNLVDAHTHTDCLTWRNLEEMSMAGIRTVIPPSARPVDNVRSHPASADPAGLKLPAMVDEGPRP